MSRTKEVQGVAQNPSELAFFYNGNTGQFGYPKPGEGQGFEDIPELPPMMVLDTDCFSVSGKSYDGQKITSNLAHQGYNVNLHVRFKESGQTIAKGQWGAIKTDVERDRGRYTGNIYFMTMKGKIVTVFLKGRALAAWFKFAEQYKDQLNNIIISTKGRVDAPATDGKIGSKVPVFVFTGTASAEQIAQADEMDKILQGYFTEYFAAPVQEENQSAPAREPVAGYQSSAPIPQPAMSGADGWPTASDEPAAMSQDDDSGLPF